MQTQIYVLLHPANCVCEFFSENKLNQSIMNLKLNEGDIHKYSHVPSINNMWTKYGEPILLCHRVSNLLKKIGNEIYLPRCIKLKCIWVTIYVQLKFYSEYSSFESFWMYGFYSHVIVNLIWSFWLLLIPDVLGILLNVKRNTRYWLTN